MHVEAARAGGLSVLRPAEHETRAASPRPSRTAGGHLRETKGGAGTSRSRLRDRDTIPDTLRSADEHQAAHGLNDRLTFTTLRIRSGRNETHVPVNSLASVHPWSHKSINSLAASLNSALLACVGALAALRGANGCFWGCWWRRRPSGAALTHIAPVRGLNFSPRAATAAEVV